MAKIIPDGPQAQLNFFRSHVAKWREQPELLGLSQAELDQLEALVLAAADAQLQSEALHNAARSATVTYESSIAAMTKLGRALVTVVKARAKLTGNTGIYPAADLPVPDTTPSERPAPPMPGNLQSRFDGGRVVLTWRTPHRHAYAGAVYFTIERQMTVANQPPNAHWVTIGTSAKREFVDPTIPPGTLRAIYRVRAHRGGKQSQSASTLMEFFSNEVRPAMVKKPTESAAA